MSNCSKPTQNNQQENHPRPAQPKWTAKDYENRPLLYWKSPRLNLFPTTDTEKHTLRSLKDTFAPLLPYKDNSTATGMESQAIDAEALVEIPTPIPPGYIAFLENTAERCTSPTTKHSQAGMNRAAAWIQRIDTPERMFERLTKGFGISLMFGERFHQFIRNSHNWRGASGIMLDIDLFKDDDHPTAPEPVYSMDELFDRYPFISRLCKYVIPSASSLYEGRPFKARGLILFPEPITDMRVYRAVGDSLLAEVDCIPANVTKNPVAVGFGNTHNAKQAYDNPTPDDAWIQQVIERAKATVLQEAHEIRERRERQQDRNRHPSAHSTKGNGTQGSKGGIEGENISEFIWNCDAISEMVKRGWLKEGKGSEYKWHQAKSDRSCEIYDDGGTIKIFSGTMTDASPKKSTPVQSHRFYLYRLTGLDLTDKKDKPKCREYLFGIGYGTDPNAPPPNRKPIRLKPRTDFELVTQPIEKARQSLKDAFDDDKRFIGFRADTGIGKTHEAIDVYRVQNTSGFFSTPTTDLAKEVEGRLRTAGCDVFRWRGLHSEQGGEFPRQKPCMFPDQYKAYSESGRNAYKMLCEQCEYLKLCSEEGYRSQEQRATSAQVTVAAHKDMLFNPTFRSTAERLLPKSPESLIVIDEFDVFDSFIKVEVTLSRLQYLAETWGNTPLGKFATDLVLRCVLPEASIYYDLQHIVSCYRKHEKEITQALASYKVDDGTILTRKQAHEHALDVCQTVEYIKALPKIETEKWNLFLQLCVFFECYRYPEGAPIEWRNNTLTFYLPPLSYYTQGRVICMSATLKEQFFSKAFAIREARHGDIGFIDADDTDWHPEAKVFQLRTNRNPRHTLLKREQNDNGAWIYTGFTDTGQRFFDAILSSVKASPQKTHALVSYKWVVENHADELEANGIIAGHFGNLLGLDQHFKRNTDTPIVLHILGSPDTPPDTTTHHFNLLYGGQGQPTDLARDDTTGEYKDSTVQEVYEAGVKAELMQAVGRAGLVKNASTVVIWTSHELPSVTYRDQTHLFDENDWQNAQGNLDALPVVIEARQAREQAAAQAEQAGDVEAVAHATGQSTRTAQRRTKKERDQRKAERNATIIRLHNEGLSQPEIAEKVGVSQPTVSRIITSIQKRQPQEDIYLERVANEYLPVETDKQGIDAQGLDRTATPARSTIVLSERRTPTVNYNDPQHYQFLPDPSPLSPSDTEFQHRVVEWAEGNRELFERLSPSDITDLMQEHPDLFEFEPFCPTGNVLDARVSDRGRLLRRESSAILLDPSRQGDSVEAIERSLFDGGDSSLYAVWRAFFLALRNNVGKRWIEAIKSAVDFEISRSHLNRDAQRANISVSRIHCYWGEAVDYRKGVVHPFVPFAKHWLG